MYEYIKGTYMGINEDYIIIENNGIGYKIYTSGNTITNIPKASEAITIYTIQIVRDDFIGLYGFLTREELSLFNLLLKVNGVGPKAALSLLSISSVANLKKAIVLGDEGLITKAPGVGKKTAQRIILELKDKIDMDGILEAAESKEDKPIDDKIRREALQALVSLGYSEKEGNKALKSVEGDNVEELIKNCLKYLMN
ncbi:Holliday junction branch migration protein RuvA [Clostridium sp. KNHs214]|uniref:Holliday junction branch migration protein RuvA n=1 Tax=Clostridium sp. KNHs214 TaxID=1540257 RepID=UPI00054DEB0A|nr:Holliday junction branch migration protein RuvA [Clostridium sp. KNHs214]